MIIYPPRRIFLTPKSIYSKASGACIGWLAFCKSTDVEVCCGCGCCGCGCGNCGCCGCGNCGCLGCGNCGCCSLSELRFKYSSRCLFGILLYCVSFCNTVGYSGNIFLISAFVVSSTGVDIESIIADMSPLAPLYEPPEVGELVPHACATATLIGSE